MKELHKDVPLNIIVYDDNSVSIGLNQQELTILVELLGAELFERNDSEEEPTEEDEEIDNLQYRLSEALRFASYDADDEFWND